MLSVAQLTARSVVVNGVDTLYCLPGLQLDPFLDAAYDLQDKLRIVHARHEQGAGYMALGAALATGKPQVYAVVAGIGFLNSSAALATILSVNARVLVLVAEIPLPAQGKGFGVLHEIPDGLQILRSLTKSAYQVTSPETAAATIAAAWRDLLSGPPGPVGLSLPLDLWHANTGQSQATPAEPLPHPVPGQDQVSKAADIIAAASAPLIVIGGGAQASSTDVTELVETLGAPVVAFRNGHGVVAADNPLRITMPVAHALWPKVDLVIGLGTRLRSQLMSWGTDPNLNIIHVSLNPDELGRIAEPTVGICADVADVAPALKAALAGRAPDTAAWRDVVRDTARTVDEAVSGKLSRQLAWLDAIRRELPPQGILVDEVTQMGYVARFGYPAFRPRTLITPGYQATLGYGYPTALGAALARPDVPVINFCGDGGALFTLNELATGMLHGINLTTVVFADGHYGNVRGIQRDHYQARYIANDLANPDFVKFAEAFGAQGLRATTPDDLRLRLREGMAHQGPTLIEVPVGEFNSPWEFVLMPKNRGPERGCQDLV